jgi:hypothetical protein
MAVIWGRREAECFSHDDWTGGIALMWLRKLVFGRNAPETIIIPDYRFTPPTAAP